MELTCLDVRGFATLHRMGDDLAKLPFSADFVHDGKIPIDEETLAQALLQGRDSVIQFVIEKTKQGSGFLKETIEKYEKTKIPVSGSIDISHCSLKNEPPKYGDVFMHTDGGIYEFLKAGLRTSDYKKPVYIYRHIWPFSDTETHWVRPAVEWNSRFEQITPADQERICSQNREKAVQIVTRNKNARKNNKDPKALATFTVQQIQL